MDTLDTSFTTNKETKIPRRAGRNREKVNTEVMQTIEPLPNTMVESPINKKAILKPVDMAK